MFLMTKAGRRGCVWGLVVCPYWGRQHSIMKRVSKASNFERLVMSVPFVPVYQLHQLQKPCKNETRFTSLWQPPLRISIHMVKKRIVQRAESFFLWCVGEPLKTIGMTWRVRGGLSLSKWCIALHRLLFFLILNIAMSDAKILKDIPSCVSTCFQSPLSLPLLFRLRLSSPAFQE